ncbi:hypothetical protein [Shimia sp. MMG029]|uniref:hypothetical protein n=1 Tax=Shimia sp. MMG029 TaxID=3021978 RepID=UPI0022FF1F8F|nr:hypothetical protein [Shimia sp. MMG029]MDA5558663.1 hypothetical protein [Shimia sp. MMG029]
MTQHDPDFEAFLTISAVLTGYSVAELQGTGCAPEYWTQFQQVLSDDVCASFLAGAAELSCQDSDKVVRDFFLSDPCHGPVARALVQLWYLGQWSPLPQDWTDMYGASRFDTARILSSRAYKEGLVWDAIGAHPMGAKQQGFGAWALEPPAGRAGS